MAARLGPLFLRAALGPINYASSRIMGREVEKGLHELEQESLLGSARRGLETVAKEVGLRPADVERHLPFAKLVPLAKQVQDVQRITLAQWRRHAGHVGGLLEGVADLTIDGRPPDLSLCLTRLAKKVRADKEWSEPLAALADVVGRYTDLLYHCRDLLDEGVALAKAHERRRLRRLVSAVAVGSLALTTVVVVSWYILHTRGARQRVEGALTRGEICAWSEIDPGDQEHATDAQRTAVAERIAECSERRERERQEREAQRRREEEARVLESQRKELEAGCAELLNAVQAGQPPGPRALGAAGKAAQLFQHAATGKLERADLAPPDPELPCANTPSKAALDQAFAQAVVEARQAWISAPDVSPLVSKILGDHHSELNDRYKSLFAMNTEKAARRALVTGDSTEVERALRLCALKRALDIKRGTYCDALSRGPKRRN